MDKMTLWGTIQFYDGGELAIEGKPSVEFTSPTTINLYFDQEGNIRAFPTA